MRIVTEPFLKGMAARFPHAASWLAVFVTTVRRARWRNIVELRQTYPHADAVIVRSGRTVIVFNVAGNKFRLIAAIHFNVQIIFTLRFLTHAEYSKNQWKEDL
jgi:mRNA interferase HigB